MILGAYFHLVFQNGPRSLPKIVYDKFFKLVIGLPRWLSGKESACQCRRRRFDPWVGKNPLEKEVATPSSILAWKSHGQRSLVDYSPRVHKSEQVSISMKRLILGNKRYYYLYNVTNYLCLSDTVITIILNVTFLFCFAFFNNQWSWIFSNTYVCYLCTYL